MLPDLKNSTTGFCSPDLRSHVQSEVKQSKPKFLRLGGPLFAGLFAPDSCQAQAHLEKGGPWTHTYFLSHLQAPAPSPKPDVLGITTSCRAPCWTMQPRRKRFRVSSASYPTERRQERVFSTRAYSFSVSKRLRNHRTGFRALFEARES